MKGICSLVFSLVLPLAVSSLWPQTTDTLFADLAPKDYLTGKFEPAALPEYFSLLPSKYCVGEQWLRIQAAQAFIDMAMAAQNQGIELKAVSSTRSFYRQKKIWEDKWTGVRKVEGRDLSKSRLNPAEKAKLIMRFSSMPGTSRHHWGTDLDINSVDEAYFKTEQGCRVYDWLLDHAHEFGFCQVYSPKQKSGRSGYQEEKWHWSFLPLAIPFTQEYQNLISNQDISGFLGCETAIKIGAIENYVLGLNSICTKQ